MFLRTLNLWSHLRLDSYKKALARYKDRPGETEIHRLAVALVRIGRGDEALRVLAQGKRAFPHSKHLKKANAEVRARKAKVLLKQAHKDLKRDPSAENHIRVSDLLRTTGNWRKALSILRQAQELFPDHCGIHFSLGKLYFHWSSASSQPLESTECVQHLQCASEQNPNHYATLLYLAMALVRVGACQDAQAILESIFKQFPTDPKARSLRAYIHKAEAEKKEIPAVAGSSLIETQLQPPNPQSTKGISQEFSEYLETLKGALGIFLLDDSGAMIDSAVKESSFFDLNDCGGVLSSLVAECRFDAERIGIGTLHSCLIANDDWRIFLRATQGNQVVAFFDKTSDEEVIDTALVNILSIAPAA